MGRHYDYQEKTIFFFDTAVVNNRCDINVGHYQLQVQCVKFHRNYTNNLVQDHMWMCAHMFVQ